MHKKITVLTFCATVFPLCSSAEAQQPKKTPRLGYLSNVEPAGESARAEAISLQVCASVATSKDRTSLLSTDMARGRSIGTQSLWQGWCV